MYIYSSCFVAIKAIKLSNAEIRYQKTSMIVCGWKFQVFVWSLYTVEIFKISISGTNLVNA